MMRLYKASALLNPLCSPIAFSFAGGRTFQDRLNQSKGGYAIPKDSTLGKVISNPGLNAYIQRVYKSTGLSLLGALATAQIAVNSGLALTNPGLCLFGGIGMSLVGILGATMTQPTKFIEEYKNNQPYLRTENSPGRIGLLGTGLAGFGLSAAPLFLYTNLVSPAILPMSIGLTCLVFGSSSLYAYTRPQDSLLTWQKSLMGGLMGLIGLQAVGLISMMFMGPNVLSAMLFRADIFLGTGLFAALVAYDTQAAIWRYREGDADHIGTSLQLFMNFWNMLIRIMQMFMIFGRND